MHLVRYLWLPILIFCLFLWRPTTAAGPVTGSGAVFYQLETVSSGSTLIPTTVWFASPEAEKSFLKEVLTIRQTLGDPFRYPLGTLNFVVIQNDPTRAQRQLFIDVEKLETFIAELALKVNVAPQNLVVKDFQNGQWIIEGTAENGQLLDTGSLLRMIVMALNQGIRQILLPLGSINGQVDNQSGQDFPFVELISTGLSDFSGSTKNRIHNIRVGSSKFNGKVIPRGQIFSFVANLGGPVDASGGYKQELVIKGKQTIPEYGGGLCQVSTTMFRAALLAGLPIKERKGHSYAVSYYNWPYGWWVDSTVYPGSADLKFENNTPGDIFVQTYLNGTRLYFKFYGRSDRRQVSLSTPIIHKNTGYGAPEYVPSANLATGRKTLKAYGHPGLSVSFQRIIRYPTVEEPVAETFYTIYRPVGAVYYVGQ